MFCRNCGSEIPSNAKFCTMCGTETVAPKNQEQKNNEGQKPNEAADQATNSTSTEQVGSVAEASSQTPSNLKAAVESNKKRSRRRMPMILLVALALALATSVAYAAYRVYTDVWMPMQQEQQGTSQPTYTVNTVTTDVSVPSNPFYSSDKRASDTWSYPQIVSSTPSSAIDNINRRIQETMENTAAKTNAYPDTWDEIQNKMESDPDEYGACTLTRGMDITYMDDTYVCIRDAGYATGWGAHGFHFSQSQTYNLQTGELVDPWTVFGMSKGEAISATEQAVKTYLTANPSDNYKTSEVISYIDDRINNYNNGYSVNESASSQTSSPFVITNEGLVYMTSDYELGSYAFGTRNILVKGFSNDSKVGTAIELSNPKVANE